MPRRKRLCVAVAGNSSLPLTPAIGTAIVDLLREYPEGTRFITRGSPGVDEFVLRACELLGLPCEPRPSAGGPDNFRRDADMARECDELLAFLDPHTLDRGDTGTAHAIDKALDQKRRVRAFSASGDKLVYVGSSD